MPVRNTALCMCPKKTQKIGIDSGGINVVILQSEIAETYINNMGAIYGSEEDWEKMRDYAFEAALTRTDVVVQPRQSNTWGALNLDHVMNSWVV